MSVAFLFSMNSDLSRFFQRGMAGISWLLFAGAGNAALEADISTSRGVVTVLLEHAKAPRAVANFITLAEGSRSWVDPVTGSVTNDPAFDGLAFHEVVNDPSDKRAACGSLDGSGLDRPGFTILDDLDPTLVHQPYVIAFASDGPNTGGSRFYFTGDISLPDRDGRDVVFGSIPSAGSRSVVNQILAAGSGATIFESVTFRRTDANAIAFDELAVSLPVVTAPSAAPLLVTLGADVRLGLARTTSTTLRASASTDLLEWQPILQSYLGPDSAVPSGFPIVEAATAARRFYHFALTEYPGAGGATGFAGRKLTVNSSGTGRIEYTFDATGMAGTFVNNPIPGDPLVFSGPFTVLTEIPAEYDAYHFSILLQPTGLGGSPRNRIRGGFDQVGPALVVGRHITTFYGGDMNPAFEESGELTLDRP